MYKSYDVSTGVLTAKTVAYGALTDMDGYKYSGTYEFDAHVYLITGKIGTNNYLYSDIPPINP